MHRLLGQSEHFLWLLSQSTPMNIVLCASVKGTLTINQLRKALKQVQYRHPLLSVKITTDDKNQPLFTEEDVPDIPLRVIDWQEERWCQEVEEELFYPIPWNTGPLVRVTFLHSTEVCQLIVTIDHCISDGLSGAYLVRDILHAASQPDTQTQRLPKQPPWEEMMPPLQKTLSIDRAKEEYLEQDRSLSRSEQKNFLDRESKKWQLRLFHWSLSPEQTHAIVTCCRKEKTTVQGALCAAFLLSIAAEIDLRHQEFVKCLSPLSLRKYLVPPIGEDFGQYISRIMTRHQCNNPSDVSQLWQIAHKVKQQINQAVISGNIFRSGSALSRFLSTKPDPIATKQYADKLVGSDLTVTNLGRLNIPQQFGQLHLQELYLTVTGSEKEPIILGVTTIGDRMCITFRYLESIIPQSIAQKIQRGAMRRLDEVVTQYADIIE
ncbi:phthiocerol/phthiodiolone dimycocerosyl transferase family protein [Scytonema sp. NUACC26]|uniref:phthiocerol/phthiodiolone dimycocerosyl transferase family protein n=1 Tax=Scytonema sp. NUACC26 TaxID=3140176 RepID=UPI0034DB8F9E